jgi:hypothetical protein
VKFFSSPGVGKCPNWTSPKYWGYNLQQILESDVQNPQNGTFTKPCHFMDSSLEGKSGKEIMEPTRGGSRVYSVDVWSTKIGFIVVVMVYITVGNITIVFIRCRQFNVQISKTSFQCLAVEPSPKPPDHSSRQRWILSLDRKISNPLLSTSAKLQKIKVVFPRFSMKSQ